LQMLPKEFFSYSVPEINVLRTIFNISHLRSTSGCFLGLSCSSFATLLQDIFDPHHEGRCGRDHGTIRE
jgi:hypothetical protein